MFTILNIFFVKKKIFLDISQKYFITLYEHTFIQLTFKILILMLLNDNR